MMPPTAAIEIVVAGEPVAKGRPRVTARGGKPRTYTPAKTRSYENLIRLAAADQMGGRHPLDTAVAVSVSAYLPIPRSWSQKKQRAAEAGEIAPAKRPDLDNFVKAAVDGCNGVVFADDAQVVELRATKAYSRRPRLEILVGRNLR